MTSGDGKIYPAGIAIARVTEIASDHVIAHPVADLHHTDFVTVYGDDSSQ